MIINVVLLIFNVLQIGVTLQFVLKYGFLLSKMNDLLCEYTKLYCEVNKGQDDKLQELADAFKKANRHFYN